MAGGVLVLYVIHRLWLVCTGRVPLDADEGILGIMALEILRGDPAVFFHGQDYLGVIDSYLLAPFILLIGASTMAIRLCCIAQGVVILMAWRRILRLWGIGGAWIYFALLFAIPTELIAVYTLKFRGMTAVLLPASLWLAVLAEIVADGRPFQQLRGRFLLLGVLTGVCWWASQLSIFFFLPAAGWLLMGVRTRGELVGWIREGALVAGLTILYLASLALLVVRGSLHYTSPFGAWILEHRSWLVGLHLLVLVAFVIAGRRVAMPGWVLAGGLGFLLAYLPALTILLSKEILYNTVQPGGFGAFLENINTLVFITGGGMMGVMHLNISSMGLPVVALAAVPVLYALLYIMLGMDVLRGIRRGIPDARGEVFLFLGSVGGLLLLCYVLRTVYAVPHYAVLPMFMSLVAFGWLCHRVSLMNRLAPMVLLAPLMAVHLHGNRSIARAEINPWTANPTEAEQVVEFLTSQGISAAATSLESSFHGYWEAYRLSYVSGERLAVHPVLHMPRIDRYRTGLQRADRFAIVSLDTRAEEVILRENGIVFEKKEFGNLDVLYGMEKRLVDEAGLLSYQESL